MLGLFRDANDSILSVDRCALVQAAEMRPKGRIVTYARDLFYMRSLETPKAHVKEEGETTGKKVSRSSRIRAEETTITAQNTYV